MGDFRPSDIIDFFFTTRFNGVPTTLAGTPAVSVYKDNSLTQSVAGVTLNVDFDGVTGYHHVRIDTSVDGAFYAAGSRFQAMLSAGTCGGVTAVGVVIDEAFGIMSEATRKLTFDSDNMLSVNAKKVNDVALDGDGSVGDPWGPA